MALINEKFTLRTEAPLPGGVAGIWMVLDTQEAIDARAAGTGPGQPDAMGTFQPGTIAAGYGVEYNSSGNAILGSSTDVTAALPKLFMVVFGGNNDFSGRFSDGKVTLVHGGVRFDTEKFASGSFVIGTPLKLVSGVWTQVAQGSHLQIAGWVGPRGKHDGVLDVIQPQGVAAGA